MNNLKYTFKSNNNKAFILLLILLFIIPWPHGGELQWQFLLFSSCIFFMLSSVLISSILDDTHHYIYNNIKEISWPLALFLLWLIYIYCQTISLPSYIIEAITPFKKHMIENITTKIEETSTISVSIQHTLLDALKNTTYIAVFFLVYILTKTRKHAYLIIYTLFITSALISSYSLINYYSKGMFLYLPPLPPWESSNYDTIHGTFSYKNNYASFLILTIPLGVGLYFNSSIKKMKTLNTRIISFIMSKHFFFLLASTTMLTALVLNSSRAGLSSLLISLFITILIFLMKNIKKLDLTKLYFYLTLMVSIFAIFIITGISDKLIRRTIKYGENGRDILRSTTIDIYQNFPFVGTGAGTYPVIQNINKSQLLEGSKIWQHAHNDYLELLSNQGLIGGLLFFFAIILLFKNLVINIKKNPVNSIQLSCICSLLAIIIHSFFDSNFQVPANTVYFFVILAIALKLQLINKVRKKEKKHAN